MEHLAEEYASNQENLKYFEKKQSNKEEPTKISDNIKKK